MLPLLGHRALHEQHERDQGQRQDGEQPEVVEVGQRRRLLLAEVVQRLQGHLLRRGRVARLLEEEGLALLEGTSSPSGLRGSRNSPTRAVWKWSRRHSKAWARDVPTLPPSLRSKANRPTAAPRRWGGMYLKAATLIETKIIDRPTINTTRGQITRSGLMYRFISAIQ